MRHNIPQEKLDALRALCEKELVNQRQLERKYVLVNPLLVMEMIDALAPPAPIISPDWKVLKEKNEGKV